MIADLIINSLVCVGFRAANDRDKVLYPLFKGPIQGLINKTNGNLNSVLTYLTKPLYSCLVCMSSFWGITYLFLSGLMVSMNWWEIGLYVLALAGVNRTMGGLLDLIIKVNRYLALLEDRS